MQMPHRDVQVRVWLSADADDWATRHAEAMGITKAAWLGRVLERQLRRDLADKLRRAGSVAKGRGRTARDRP